MQTVLILTAGYGEGHNSAARALEAAFNERPDTRAELVDIFALRAPRLNHISRLGYIRVINSAPRIWSSIYSWLDKSPRVPALFRGLASHRRLLGKIIAEKKPAAIVSTYPVYAWLLNELRREGLQFCPHHTVVTDALTINSLWYRSGSAGWFVTDDDSAAFLREKNVPAEKIHVTGFPVALAFADRPAHLAPPEPVSPTQPRRVLFMINCGRARAVAIARALLRNPAWHVTITAGRDESLQTELKAIAAKSFATYEILGWTNRIPDLLMTHHVIISKAGGATTQESINALCPMLVNQIVPGQEEGNYELIRRNEAGALAETPEMIVATLNAAFADNAALWRKWRGNLGLFAQPNAARNIAATVLAPIEASPIGSGAISPARHHTVSAL
ncbi:MGDG synthase family glycosyltransferase [Oleiharenicola lentus]|uniref:MGDG synthase family glycosyltransferase n=1 Tax=Oleiharenicola lentus TaxID=2508720 RepID=UPI003F662A20